MHMTYGPVHFNKTKTVPPHMKHYPHEIQHLGMELSEVIPKDRYMPEAQTQASLWVRILTILIQTSALLPDLSKPDIGAQWIKQHSLDANLAEKLRQKYYGEHLHTLANQALTLSKCLTSMAGMSYPSKFQNNLHALSQASPTKKPPTNSQIIQPT